MQRTASSERLSHIPGYQVLRRLSQNQFSITYLAKQVDSQHKVMLKVFAPHLSQRPDFNTRFLQGCEALRQWRHPNIVRLYEGGVHRGAHYLSLEYVSGGTRIDDLPLEQPTHVLRWIADLARAVQYANSKDFSHGCIEAAGVLMHRERRVMLTGFEQQLLDVAPVPHAGHYLSPERQQGEAAGVPGDIYSLGMLLYCLLVRRAPTAADLAAGEELKQVEPSVPSLPGNLLVLQPLINRTLAAESERRFRSAAVLADAIDAVTDEDIEAILIATPHYMASINGSPLALNASVMKEDDTIATPPTLTDALPSKTESPGQTQIAPRVTDTKRHTGFWIGLGVVVLIVASLVVFRDRLPPAAGLLAKAEDETHAAMEWLERVAGTSGAAPVVTMPESTAAEENTDRAETIFISEPESVAVPAPLTHGESSISDPAPTVVLPDEPAFTETSTATPESTQYTAEDTEQSDSYVAEGDRLLAEDALTLPLEANALTAYQHALALDPRNAQAWAGLQQIVTRYVQLAEARVAAEDWSGAAEFVRRGLGVDAKHPDLLALQSRLSMETDAPSASLEDVERLGALARVQMVRENYVTPAGESAFDHYSRLLLMAPDSAEARSGLARIERELASDIELLVNRNRFDQARILLVTARDHFPTSQRFYNLTLALEAAAQSERDRRASIQHSVQ